MGQFVKGPNCAGSDCAGSDGLGSDRVVRNRAVPDRTCARVSSQNRATLQPDGWKWDLCSLNGPEHMRTANCLFRLFLPNIFGSFYPQCMYLHYPSSRIVCCI